MIRRIPLLAVLVGALLVLTASTRSQQLELPADLQLGLLSKVLSYDRSGALGSEIVVVVLYQPELPASVRARDDWLQAAQRSPPNTGLAQIFVLALPLTDGYLDRLQEYATDVVVLAPLRAVDVRRAAEGIRRAGIRTVTGHAGYGRGVAAITLVLRDGRPRIIIDEKLAQREGAQFSSQLLRVAEVVR